MADAMAGALSPETMGKLAAASANGRMLLGMLALWMDREAIPRTWRSLTTRAA